MSHPIKKNKKKQLLYYLSKVINVQSKKKLLKEGDL